MGWGKRGGPSEIRGKREEKRLMGKFFCAKLCYMRYLNLGIGALRNSNFWN